MYMTREVKLGNLTLGGNNPVWVQSMTNTDTRDAEATLAQIRALADAGCDIVRCSVYDDTKKNYHSTADYSYCFFKFWTFVQ